MVDQAKRETLKNVARIGVGSVAMASSSVVLSSAIPTTALSATVLADTAETDLVDIQITTSVSSITNELEVVLTNTGSVPARITDMTPAEIKTPRGHFNFNALFESGDLNLAIGESVRVPMQQHPVLLDASSIGNRSLSLSDALRRTVSIVADGDSLAAVSHVNGLVAA